MSNVSQWSTTAASNNSAAPDGAPENMSPAGVNDVIRENMAATSKWYKDTNGTLVTGGTSTAYTLTTNNAHSALADQSAIVFRVDQANTGSSTLNVDSLGAKTMKLNGENLSADDLVANSIVMAVYNANQDVYDIIKSNSATEPSITRSARTSNTILGTSDNNTLVDFTANTFTQTLTAAATLGAGWYVYLKNSGTGDITLDPNGSETIDGLTTFVMYPGESRLLQCDGSNFNSVVLAPFGKAFTSSGTFTKPPGYSLFKVECVGGGGGGCGATQFSGGAGGAGGVSFTEIAESLISTTETVTVGAGGSGGAADSNSNGVAGGSSTFGSLLTGYGGGYGAGGSGNGGGGGGGFTSVGSNGGSSGGAGGGLNGGAGGTGGGAAGNAGDLFSGGGGGDSGDSGGIAYSGGGGGGGHADVGGSALFGPGGGGGGGSGSGGTGSAGGTTGVITAGGGGAGGVGDDANGADGTSRTWGYGDGGGGGGAGQSGTPSLGGDGGAGGQPGGGGGAAGPRNNTGSGGAGGAGGNGIVRVWGIV